MTNKKDFSQLAKKHSTPLQVQKYIFSMPYNNEPNGETLSSAWTTYRKNKAHCLEAALLAAAILEKKGYPPLVMSLESQDNLDHVIFVYKKNKRWGSVARSRDRGLHGRKPVYRSLRDLARSYYEPYVDKTGCLTGYQIANLDDMGSDWRFSRRNVWKVEQYLIDIKHVHFKYNKKRYKKLHRRYLSGKTIPLKAHWL
jgi:hypothetical protein